MKAGSRLLIRWLVTLALLGMVLWLVDVGAILAQLASVDLPWLLLALAITPLQVVVSAWRWRYTVARRGEQLPWGHAIREYYLGTLVNQLVPGGVVGDAGRALRHRRNTGRTATAIHGVMIERFSGQLVLLLLAIVLIALWLPLPTPPMPGLFLVPGVLVAALLAWSLLQAPPVRAWLVPGGDWQLPAGVLVPGHGHRAGDRPVRSLAADGPVHRVADGHGGAPDYHGLGR